MHIGITIGLQKPNESIWINGIKMNAIFLANVLKKTGNRVTIVDTSNKLTVKELKTDVAWDTKEFPVKRYIDIAKDIDVLVMLGTSLAESDLKHFKLLGPNKKIIKYACGNNYVIDMERCIFPKGDKKDAGIAAYQRGTVDEVWYVPQQGYQNHHYYRVLHDLPNDKVRPVPFIWDPMFIDQACEDFSRVVENNEESLKENNIIGFPIYKPGKPKENLDFCIFEPNLNVVKYSAIPILIAEEYFRNGNKFRDLNIMSTMHMYDNAYWNSIVTKLDIFKSPDVNFKVSGRLPVVSMLSKKADIVISHQWENPLNYAYMDVMYLNYPLIHNADMIKDAGYYYEGFDISAGFEQLNKAVHEHDANLEAYTENVETVLTRYTVYNEELIDTYGKLLDNLQRGENYHNISSEYDWKTNLYK